jgi:cytochrome P450
MNIDYDPFSPRFRDDPYPVYRALREQAPVHFAPASKLFCVSRHEDVSHVLRRPDLFSSSAMATVLMDADLGPMRPRTVFALARFLMKARTSPIAIRNRGNLTSIDPPRHDVMRRIVNRAFTPKRIDAWEGRAREIVATQLAKLGRGEVFDVVEDLAIPLPVTIIAEMLGVEPERQRDFKRWSDAIISAASGSARQNPIESGMLDSFGDLYAYLRETVRRRRDAPADDLVSVLVDPSQDGVLDELDVVQFVMLLLVAGNETTTNLIGNAAYALLEHPEQLARVASDPSLVPALIEETLRWDAPIQMLFRTASCDTEVAGTAIPKGATVVPLLGSANRDERVFEAPDRFDVGRDAKGHLAFGLGLHFCLGSALARLEARVALEALVPLLASFETEFEDAPFVDSFLVRGRTRLPLVASRAG